MAEQKKQKRVYAGYYKRYDGKKIYVVRAVKDADTGEAIIICKECTYSDLKKEIYYTITKSSFCGSIEKNGTMIPKYIRMTNIPITEGEINECMGMLPHQAKSKKPAVGGFSIFDGKRHCLPIVFGVPDTLLAHCVWRPRHIACSHSNL